MASLDGPVTENENTNMPANSVSPISKMCNNFSENLTVSTPRNETKLDEGNDRDCTQIDDVTTQSENSVLNTDNKVDSKTKRKRSRKRGKVTKLQMPNQLHSHNMVQPNSPIAPGLITNNIHPYAYTSNNHLENLYHHPQFQYMYGLKMIQNHMYAPTVQTMNTPPNTPYVLTEPRSPQYLQNVMQHPLLRQSYPVESCNNQMNPLFRQARQVNQPNSSKSPKKKSVNNKENSFEPYMSELEVQGGIKNGKLLEGVLRINPKQYQHSYVSSCDRSEQDILIDGLKNRNRALEGDIVVVQILDETSEDSSDENRQKKGKVVFIKEKVHTRSCIGVLKLMQDRNRQKALFTPRDHRIPRLYIPCTSWPDNFYKDAKKYENTLFLAKILDWTDTRFALGTISCMIGQSGDMGTENKAILAQNDLDITPFGPEVKHFFPSSDYVIPEDEIVKREDCRHLCLFSIDPYNCRDIDDAVSCRNLDNGNYEIGVHISDVAHYLTENTILDEKVAEKATTIYMVERAYHMLPDELCLLCSLFPGEDKLAFSVFWEITEDATVVNHRFAKTVIHSCSQLSYEHAQDILDNKEDAKNDFPEIFNGFQFEDIHKTIKILGKLSATFRNKRFEEGALRIDQPKVSFSLNATGSPDSFSIYESKESHQLIEEFMLLANKTVAERIYEDHPTLAFLRCHPPPSTYMLKQLAKSLKPMGIDLDISSAGDLHKSLLPYVGPESQDRGKAMVLNMLCAKPMTRAKYFCAGGVEESEDFCHYALNMPLYTHFTSPIRRYADVMVHRLLAASLKWRNNPDWDVDKVRAIAAQCNKQKYNAKRAGEMSTELYTLKYIEVHSPMVTEAVVVDVREKYIDVIIVAFGLNRRIFFNNDFPGKYNCIKSDASSKLSKMILTWNATKDVPESTHPIEVFSILQVEMHKGDDMVKVETRLVRPS